MKNIDTYIVEKTNNFWNNKYISQNDIIKLSGEALKKCKITPDSIMNEIGQFDDPDNLNDAIDRGELSDYSEFENTLSEILKNNIKYKKYCDEILEDVLLFAYDLMTNIEKISV